jgi:hypothetical protein
MMIFGGGLVVGYCHPHIQKDPDFPNMVILGVSTQDNLFVCVWFEWRLKRNNSYGRSSGCSHEDRAFFIFFIFYFFFFFLFNLW